MRFTDGPFSLGRAQSERSFAMRGMNRNLATAFVLLISLGYPAKSGAVDFAPPKSYPVGTSPRAVVVGDFNGDGKPDIAVANSDSANVSVLLGNGDGTLKPAVNFGVGNSPLAISIGDFNGDGKLDLAVFQPGDPTNNVAGAVSILLGYGDGTFQVAKTTALTTQAASMAIGDFNSDKKADIVIGNIDPATGNLTLDLFIGNGDGTLLALRALSTFSNGTKALLATDLNGDGKLDLAVGTASGVNILLGKGDGTFQPATVGVVTAPSPIVSIQVADLTRSGKQDLVVESFSRATPPPGCHEFCFSFTFSSLRTYLGNGDGTFQGGQVVFNLFANGGGVGPRSYALGDYNGDKKVDLVYANTTGKILGATGKDTGTFSIPVLLDVASGSVASAADLNVDGLSDLLALGPGNAISVFLNTSPTSGADLGILQASVSPEPVGVGSNLTYTADVFNQGPKDATGVTFTDTLPNAVGFVSATAAQGSCVQSQGIVTCDIGSLAAAFEASVTIVVTPTAPGTIANSMSVTATESDPVPANNSATQTSTVLTPYKLTITKTGNGSGSIGASDGLINCGSGCSVTYLSGTVVNLNQAADSGSLFQSWGGACSGNQTCSVTMDGDKTITASFVLGMTLNVTLAGTGTGTVTSSDGTVNCVGGSCSVLYFPSTSESLTATPSAGSTFAGWSGACTGADPKTCNITLNSSQSVTATFTVPPDFTPTPAAMSLTMNRGGQVTDVLTFPALGGFSGTIALTCSVSGPSPMPTCGISPASVTPGANATLTVNAAALSASLTAPWFEQGAKLYAAWLPLGLLGCVLATSFDKKRRRHWALCLLMLVATFVPTACNSGSSTVHTTPPPQNYTVTVTATSGALQHSTAVAVTVN
jgi:uncharacterized repeat protein (TIGR01451 family)